MKTASVLNKKGISTLDAKRRYKPKSLEKSWMPAKTMMMAKNWGRKKYIRILLVNDNMTLTGRSEQSNSLMLWNDDVFAKSLKYTLDKLSTPQSKRLAMLQLIVSGTFEAFQRWNGRQISRK